MFESFSRRKRIQVSMRTFRRYVLFQIPGWLLAALVLSIFTQTAELSRRAAIWLFLLWVAKDFVLYPLLRRSYEADVRTGSERLIGERGTTKEWLRPVGYVQVHGHLWRAEAEPRDRPISPGTPIRVTGANGLTLTVSEDGQ
jgi:membrane protein implicated in regulation of membrane protease activity